MVVHQQKLQTYDKIYLVTNKTHTHTERSGFLPFRDTQVTDKSSARPFMYGTHTHTHT